jgi:hypothetical protein
MSKEIPEHRDVLGNLINMGDCVAMPAGNSLRIGIVTKLNPKMVQVKRVGTKYESKGNKYPMDLVVLNSQDVTMYLLKAGAK